MYRDRQDAGRQLSERLAGLAPAGVIVIALPRGGVVVGYEVARSLGAPLEIIAARKLGAPSHPEFGFGAIAPGGAKILDDRTVRALGLSSKEVERIISAETQEMNRRERRYRGGREMIKLAGRTIILVDDGLATGVTAIAAARAARKFGAVRIILAVPVGPPESVAAVAREVDEVVCPLQPGLFQAVGQWYEHFDQVADEEVIELLQQAWREQGELGNTQEFS